MTGTLVRFRWRDAVTKERWNPESEDAVTPMEAEVCGFVIEDADEYLTVGQERYDDGEWWHIICVPKAMIVGPVVPLVQAS